MKGLFLFDDSGAQRSHLGVQSLILLPCFRKIDPVFGRIDCRTDIYGLGALLDTLLTGRPPFTATRIPDILAQIVSQSPIPPSKLRPGISGEIDSLCMRCLSKMPDTRVASVAELLRAIDVFPPQNPQNQKNLMPY